MPETPILGPRFEEALIYASRLHRNQRRKGTTIPYVSHLLGVTAIALEIGADEDQAIAALLHDVVEDQGGAPVLCDIRARFGERVAAIVADCSDSLGETRLSWCQRKQAYIASLATKPGASLLVSLADKTHNARAILDDLRVHGDALWARFSGGRDGVQGYYQELARAFQAHLPGPASDRLAALVGEIAAEIDRKAV